MTSTRADPKKQRFPSLYGKLVIDTIRGQLRVRSWPRKRGTSKSAAVRSQNDWFKNAVRLAKFAPASQQKVAIEAALGTGLYPRDLLINAQSGGMFDIVLPDGRVLTSQKPFLEEVMFLGAILEQDTIQALPGAAYTSLTFPLPVIDTTDFWNVAAPTRLTVPAGVEVVNVMGGWKRDGLTLNGTQVASIRKNGVFIARFPTNVNGWPGGYVSTGPRAVVEGDWFDFQVFVAAATATNGDQENFFAIQVLGTD